MSAKRTWFFPGRASAIILAGSLVALVAAVAFIAMAGHWQTLGFTIGVFAMMAAGLATASIARLTLVAIALPIALLVALISAGNVATLDYLRSQGRQVDAVVDSRRCSHTKSGCVYTYHLVSAADGHPLNRPMSPPSSDNLSVGARLTVYEDRHGIVGPRDVYDDSYFADDNGVLIWSSSISLAIVLFSVALGRRPRRAAAK